MLDVDVPHIYYLHVYRPDGLSTEIGFLILDEISSIYLWRWMVQAYGDDEWEAQVYLVVCPELSDPSKT